MLDLSKIQVQLPELPQMNLEELLGDLDLTVSPEGFLPLAESLTEGYAEYAAAHPEADYSALAQQFGQYLGTPKAQEIIRRNISEIIQSGGGMSVTMEQLQAMVKEIAKDTENLSLKTAIRIRLSLMNIWRNICRQKKRKRY